MKTYELTYIISSQLNSEQADSVKNEIESFIQSKEGIILKSEKMGAIPLSYPIKKQASGYFNTTTLQTDEQKIKEVKDTLDKNKNVLRSIIMIKKPVKVKERRTRRPIDISGFETKRKPFTMETIMKKETKKEEKVDAVDLDKKLDELLSE